MQTKLVSPNNENNIIKFAVNLLKEGEVIAFPTETVYGIGCDLFNLEAVNKIYELKKRSKKNPLAAYPVDISKVTEIAIDIPDMFYALAERFLPGPLTVILKKNPIISDEVTAGLDTIGIRLPDNQIFIDLIKEFGGIIAGTSANLSGSLSPTVASEVAHDFKGLIPLIIDGGKAEFSIESTVISLADERPLILREGAISKEEIELVARSEFFYHQFKPQISEEDAGLLQLKSKVVLIESIEETEAFSELPAQSYLLIATAENRVKSRGVNFIELKKETLLEELLFADKIGFEYIIILLDSKSKGITELLKRIRI